MIAWFVRSTSDGDTHAGRLKRDGELRTLCGLVFSPTRFVLTRRTPALPGEPPDPDQVCPRCRYERARHAGE